MGPHLACFATALLATIPVGSDSSTVDLPDGLLSELLDAKRLATAGGPDGRSQINFWLRGFETVAGQT